MTRQNDFPDFDEAIASVRNSDPDPREMGAAGDRVWQRIQAAYADPHFTTVAETLRACQQFRELMPESEAGTLSAGKVLLLQDHLRECVACRHYAKGISDTDAARWTPAYQLAAITEWNWRRASMYVTILVAAVVGAWAVNTFYFAVPAGSRAKVEETNGTVYRVAANREEPVSVGAEINEGQLLRTTGGSHAFVRLSDGSRVEMNERVEFSVSARRNDTTIHLDRGNVIV